MRMGPPWWDGHPSYKDTNLFPFLNNINSLYLRTFALALPSSQNDFTAKVKGWLLPTIRIPGKVPFPQRGSSSQELEVTALSHPHITLLNSLQTRHPYIFICYFIYLFKKPLCLTLKNKYSIKIMTLFVLFAW